MREEPHADGMTDVVIVGAGLAGLLVALRLAPRRCLVLSPSPLGEQTSSAWAQGGIAAALAPDDTPARHAADTLAAGAGLTDPAVARLIAAEARERVRELADLGVPFDRLPDGRLALSREAAHTRARVARVAGDLAGRAIMGALARAACAQSHVTLLEGARALALTRTASGRVAGVDIATSHNRISTIAARHVILASGGIGGLFRVTTNPAQSRGDAIALALRAGGCVADAEFVQFHPTAIDTGQDPAPLATEALRGEGAVLRDRDGRAFMADYHPDGDLAPRDVAARAVASETAAGRGAFLDCREAVGEAFPDQFPTVFSACVAAGLDPRRQMIPISPAAHYHMGGVATDQWGATGIEGLSACGECAATGAHGANRLASNSLLEAAVFAHRVATRLMEDALPEPAGGQSVRPSLTPARVLEELRARMSRDCGVVRHGSALAELLAWIVSSRQAFGDSNALLAAQVIVAAAIARTESRGAHFRSDHPALQNPARHSLVRSAPELAVTVNMVESQRVSAALA